MLVFGTTSIHVFTCFRSLLLLPPLRILAAQQLLVVSGALVRVVEERISQLMLLVPLPD